MTPTSQTGLEVLVLFLLLVSRQDLSRVLAALPANLRIRHPNVEDGSGSALPEATDCDISAGFWVDGGLCAGRSSGRGGGLTGVD